MRIIEAMTQMRMGALRQLRGALPAVLSATLLAGCTALQLQPKPMSFYDLGLGGEPTLAASIAPAAVDVAAPPWLSTSLMQYRLGWTDPSRRRAYTQARWSAPPAEMLHVLLERGLNAGAGGTHCRMRIELYEFQQFFESASTSTVEIVLRAGLSRPRVDHPFAVREFRARQVTTTADAAGGVAAYRLAAEQLASEIGAWVTALDREPGEGLNMATRCSG